MQLPVVYQTKVNIPNTTLLTGNVLFVLGHETAHALISEFAIPVLGREEDAADALACAICHAHGGLGLGKLQTRGFRMKRGRLV